MRTDYSHHRIRIAQQIPFSIPESSLPRPTIKPTNQQPTNRPSIHPLIVLHSRPSAIIIAEAVAATLDGGAGQQRLLVISRHPSDIGNPVQNAACSNRSFPSWFSPG